MLNVFLRARVDVIIKRILKLEGFDYSTDDSRKLAADYVRPADADPKGGRPWPTCCKTPSAAIWYLVVAAMANLVLQERMFKTRL